MEIETMASKGIVGGMYYVRGYTKPIFLYNLHINSVFDLIIHRSKFYKSLAGK